MDFGLICEGPTDQATIENLICGIFENEDLFELITPLQPGGKSDTNKDGGWERVLEYIASNNFRQSFTMVKNVIIQIDTDVANMQGFDVDLRDDNGKTIKSVPEIVNRVKNRLIQQINSIEDNFFEKYQDRIIFAISVHSIEIWIYKHYDNHSKVKQINGGERALVAELLKKKELKVYTEQGQRKTTLMVKTYANYDELTRSFYDKKTCTQSIANLYKKDESFKIFKDDIDGLNYPE